MHFISPDLLLNSRAVHKCTVHTCTQYFFFQKYILHLLMKIELNNEIEKSGGHEV